QRKKGDRMKGPSSHEYVACYLDSFGGKSSININKLAIAYREYAIWPNEAMLAQDKIITGHITKFKL
ncbi:17748_t:CDS:2, partial [Racocetra persica]